jgi:predicted RNA methylase
MKFNSVDSYGKKCHKLELDQYYTSYDDMEYCVNKAWDVVKELGYGVSEFLEPSAGEGIFSDYLATSGLDVIAIDIDPKGKDIIKADFLTYELEYKKGRFIIGNPPYGARLNLAQKFYKRAIELGDYIAFILPISQLDNISSMYEFDLVYSEDLGNLIFSNKKKVHCCLNVYVRPKNGLNKKKSSKLKDIEIVRQDSKRYKDFEFDIRMCYWGDATAGKILSDDEKYSGEYKIKIHNKKLKDDIINILTNTDWKKELNSTAMCKIEQYHIINVLKKYIPDIK